MVLVLAAGLTLWWMRSPPAPPASGIASAPTAGGAVQPASYVDNQLCLGCHQEQARQWQPSHHAQAMATATAATVRGDFNDTVFKHQGVTSRFFRQGDKFFVHTDGPDGKLADFEIAYTFGVEPLQQYLIALPGGRLQPLQIAWDTRARRWFHLLPNEKAPPGDVLHWTGRYQTANTMCIACHTTGFEKRYDAASDSFASTWKEPNVSCQSCHGPGERHAQWARLKADGQTLPTLPGEPYGLVVDFKAAGAPRTGGGLRRLPFAARRAHGHARAGPAAPGPLPAEPAAGRPVPPRRPAARRGLRRRLVPAEQDVRQGRGLHRLPQRAHRQTQARRQCGLHAVPRDRRRTRSSPSAAGAYDTPAHHFHKQGSAGAQCVACHMPSKTYMQIQARPDHSLRVPRPDLSVKLGTPNACTQCHADKPAQWAADRVAAWYGPERRQEPHYGEAFAAARAGQPGANEALARHRRRPQPAGHRARHRAGRAAQRPEHRRQRPHRGHPRRRPQACAPRRPTASKPCPTRSACTG